jgi:tRNA pseudouridine38-40 synthase
MRYALLIAYDGTDLTGWWRQAEGRSVAGCLDAAFALLGEPAAAVVGASRTDAGVHAHGQVAHVDCERTWDVRDLVRSLNRHLPPAAVVRGAVAVDPDFHAVHAVVAKTYRYAVDLGPVADPFLARWAWRPPYHLDPTRLPALAARVTAMTTAAAFARRGDQRDDLSVAIRSCRWHRRGSTWIASITADRFTYRLVRSLVGGMLATAQGTCSDAQWSAALTGEDSPAGQQQAPARGLHLWRVTYPRPLVFTPSIPRP